MMAVIKPQNSCCEVLWVIVDDLHLDIKILRSRCLKKIRARAMEGNVQRRDWKSGCSQICKAAAQI